MRFLSILTAALLSSFTIASPLSNTERESLETRATTCVVSHLVIFNDNIKYGVPFCQFYVSNSRNRSPAPGLSAQQVYDVCQCIIDGEFQPAARVGVDYSPISTFKAATRTIVQYSTVTTVQSVPVLTTRISTVTEKRTIVETVTAKASSTGTAKTTVTQKFTTAKTTVTQKVTIAKTTITQKVTIAKTTVTANGATTSTVAKTTITLRPAAPAKTSTITVAQTIVQKSTLTIAKTTITANNQNAKPTTVIRTTTLSAIGSPQKTVTIAKTTITTKASGATTASSGSVKTVTSFKTVNSPQKTVTVATTVTARASSTARVSSAAQIVSIRTVTSVKTIAAQTTATRVVTFYPSIITITNTLTQAGTQAATTATTVITLRSSTGSSVEPSKASGVVSNTKPVPATSGASSKTATASASVSAAASSASISAAASSVSSAAASSTSDEVTSTCPLAPTATPTTDVTVGDTKYERFYRGCGYTEDTNNPGNYYYSDNFPPVVTNFTEVLTADQAVQQCAEDAYYRFDDPNQYLSFDLHFISNGSPGRAGDAGAGFWQCVQYFSEQSDTDTSGFFSVANPAVLIAYGYSSGLYSDAAAAAAKSNSKRNAVEENSHIHPPTRGQRLTYGFGNHTHAGH